MKKLFTTFLSVVSSCAIAQIDTTINLDLLRAPASPASNMVGISTNEIQKPTTLKDFAVSLQNATENFSALPANFAVDLAPFKLGRVQKIAELLRNDMSFARVFKNSLVVSLASKAGSDRTSKTDSTQIGLGFRFSIIQGKVDNSVTSILNDIYSCMDESNAFADTINQIVDAEFRTTDSFKAIQKRQVELRRVLQTLSVGNIERRPIEEELDSLARAAQLARDLIRSKLKSDLKPLQIIADSLSLAAFKKLEEFKIQRYGFTMDLAGGVAFNFPDNHFKSGRLYKNAAWLTFGWLYKNGFSILGIGRYQYNPDKVFADSGEALKSTNVNTLDGGMRLDYSGNQKSKFSINGEYIYRGVLNSRVVKPSWRATVNANYEIKKNNILTFSFGRDFDKKIYKDGNVVAAISLIAGFGNSQSR